MRGATLGWLDIVLVVMLVASVAFGLRQGLIRQLFLLVAMYVGTALSAQYHEQASGAILYLSPSASPEIARLIAFLLLMTAFTGLVTWLMWAGYREARLPSVVMADEIFGALLGGVIGILAINLMLALARYALAAPWPEGSAMQSTLYSGLLNSTLQALFSYPMPLIRSALLPWLPSGIPVLLSS